MYCKALYFLTAPMHLCLASILKLCKCKNIYRGSRIILDWNWYLNHPILLKFFLACFSFSILWSPRWVSVFDFAVLDTATEFRRQKYVLPTPKIISLISLGAGLVLGMLHFWTDTDSRFVSSSLVFSHSLESEILRSKNYLVNHFSI